MNLSKEYNSSFTDDASTEGIEGSWFVALDLLLCDVVTFLLITKGKASIGSRGDFSLLLIRVTPLPVEEVGES
jgi:hypothetical protein